jgi:uncharacterized RDD family membrane protein YckC
MLYEAMLLFGVVFITSWLFDTLTQSRHALTLRHARQGLLFVVLGLYFVYFWTHGGQTLAMKTWRVKVIAPGRASVPLARAIARYLFAWLWFLPALVISFALHLSGWASVLMIAANMVLWAAAILLHPDRQFLQDRLAGTRVIEYTAPPVPKKVKRK